MMLQYGSLSDFSIMLFGNEDIMLSTVIVVIVVCGDIYVVNFRVEIIYYWHYKALRISILT